MTNKMAIRFEQPRDESSLWSLAAACTAFATASEPDGCLASTVCDRKFALDSGEDLERNSASASPDDCFSDLQQAENFNGRFSIAGNMTDIPIPPIKLLSPIHSSVETIFKYNMSQQSRFGAYELAAGSANASLVCEKHSQPSQKYNELSEGDIFNRHTLPPMSHTAASDDHFSRQAKRKRPGGDQNGVEDNSPVLGEDDFRPIAASIDRKESDMTSKHRRTKRGTDKPKGSQEFPRSSKNGGRTSLQTSNRMTVKVCETNCSAGACKEAIATRYEESNMSKPMKSISDKFRESDAAEALLNLFAAVPQPPDQEAIAVHQLQTLDYVDSNDIAQSTVESAEKVKSDSCPRDTNPGAQNDSEVGKSGEHVCVQEQCESSSANTLSRFHFKKAICRKFAESMDQDNEQVAAEMNKSANGTPQGPAASQSESENGAAGDPGLSRPKTDDGRTVVLTKDISCNRESSKKHTAIHKTPKDEMRKRGKHGNVVTERKVLKPCERHHNKFESSIKCNTQKHIRLSAKSNLYRISSTLGSSSESLCVSDDNDPELASDSESSSQYTSSSEDEDSRQSYDDGSVKKMTDFNAKFPNCHDAKRRFVLSKPKFSLPARVKSKQAITGLQSVADSAGTTQLPFLKTGSKAFGSVRTQSDNLFSRADAPSPKDKHCKGNVARGVSSQKQNNHIKQAIFKFHSSSTSTVDAATKRPDQHDKKDTLNSTLGLKSKANFSFSLNDDVFTTKYDVNNNNSQRNVLAPGSSNDGKNTSVFTTYQGGASFETLSVERSRSPFQHLSPKSKTTLSCVKRRLPQPTARSPALEAKQLEKLKPGRKRKVSNALYFASSAQALRTTRHKGSAEQFCDNEHKMVRHCKTLNSRLQPEIGYSRYWKDMTVDNASNASSSRSSSLDTCSSESVTSSSRTSSLAGDDPVGVEKDCKSVRRPPSNQTQGSKSLKRSSARNVKRLALRNKRRRNAACESVSLNCQVSNSPQHLAVQPPDDALSADCKVTDFRLLSCFPTPASLTAGPARGELLPSPGSSVSRIPTGHAAFRWSKGLDVRELKQKRQRERWRHMTLDMFCMGASHR